MELINFTFICTVYDLANHYYLNELTNSGIFLSIWLVYEPSQA